MSSTNQNDLKIQNNSVVTLDYTLRVEGEIIDSSEENDPIQFIQGHGHIIPGLEGELYGMGTGDSKSVVVLPDQGYGEIDQDAYADIPRNEFPAHIPLDIGTALQLRDQDGAVLDAYIDTVAEDQIRLTFNHPLAGKTLHFDVTVVDIRDATPEELAHGHVHDDDGDEEDEEDWDDEGDLEYVEEDEWEEDEQDQ